MYVYHSLFGAALAIPAIPPAWLHQMLPGALEPIAFLRLPFI
ncbi:hypothetical protein [Cohnella sp. REN36]|nr:hypothetical protein [Cohnella sp. REN36]